MAGFSPERAVGWLGSRAVRRSLFLLILFASLQLSSGIQSLPAQNRAAGRVVRIAQGDTVAVGPVPVVLHRVSQATQGPLDTVSTDARGRFAVRFQGDTSAVHLLSVRYLGIEYFSQPVSGDPRRPDTALVLVVADTSSTAPIRVAERTLLVGGIDESGSRTVIDWLVLENPGERTRVPADTVRPSWALPLPPQAQNVELADVHVGQFSPDAVVFRRDSALVFAPVSPGRKELVLQYHVPRGERRLVVPAEATDSVFVLLEEPEARVEQPALERTTAQQVENRSFQRWVGRMDRADRLEIAFPSPGPSPRGFLALLLGASALGFAILARVFFRRRSAPAAPPPHPIALADAIARLDERYLDPAGSFTAEEQAWYQAERARLKGALARALAGFSRGS